LKFPKQISMFRVLRLLMWKLKKKPLCLFSKKIRFNLPRPCAALDINNLHLEEYVTGLYLQFYQTNYFFSIHMHTWWSLLPGTCVEKFHSVRI
jgi:hypothetical protein